MKRNKKKGTAKTFLRYTQKKKLCKTIFSFLSSRTYACFVIHVLGTCFCNIDIHFVLINFYTKTNKSKFIFNLIVKIRGQQPVPVTRPFLISCFTFSLKLSYLILQLNKIVYQWHVSNQSRRLRTRQIASQMPKWQSQWHSFNNSK